jgi:hypothetical protein
MDRSYVYQVRKVDNEFFAAWDRAEQEAVDLLEAAAWQRATKGCEEPVYMKDENGKIKLVTKIPRYSDTLLIFLLKAGRPAKYRETIRSELSGPEGGPIPVEDKTPQKRLTPDECRAILVRTGGDPMARLVGNGNGSPEETNGHTEA